MGWLWLGLVLGLLVGTGVVALVVRSVGRITGTGRRSVGRLIVDGLTPGRRRDGVTAQRVLARRLQRAGGRTASGRRVAAQQLAVHVSPEDHEAISAALGIDTAQADLADYYRGLATRGGWIVGQQPEVRIERDISLRPRQAFVRVTVEAVAAAAAGAAVPAPAPTRPPVAPSSRVPKPVPVPVPAPAPAPAGSPRLDDAMTDVLPRTLLEDAGPFATAVYPAGALLGDLVVVHGTDVRTVAAPMGALRIGKGRHNDLVLDRPGIGRDHLVLEARGDAWWIVPGMGRTVLGGAALDAPRAVSGGETLELGRGVRVRLSVTPA